MTANRTASEGGPWAADIQIGAMELASSRVKGKAAPELVGLLEA